MGNQLLHIPATHPNTTRFTVRNLRMLLFACTMLCGALSGLKAQTLMTIPPHASLYTASVRGYWFVAPTNFTIVGLRVSPEAGTGLQYIHLMKINDATPVVYSVSSTNFTTLAYISGATNNVIQSVNIPVSTGDIIGVLGSAGTSNSYSGAVTPYATTIGGFSCNLGRLLYQGNITTAQAPNYSTEATGAISRVELYYNIGGGCTGTPTAPLISTAAQTAPVCVNGTATIAATNTGAPTGIIYQWQQSSVAAGPFTNVTGGIGGSTLTYTTAALTATTYYRLNAICGSNTASSAVYEVKVGVDAPGGILGSTTFCSGSSQTYSVTPVFGATSYTWTTPAGWSGTSSTYSLTTIAGTIPGNITVTVNSACGQTGPSTLAVTPGTAPPQPTSIVGNNVVCPGSSQPYSITAVPGAASYQWTLPSGWTGTSIGTSITVVPNGTAGTISVAAVNSCGPGVAQTLPVTTSTAAPPQPAAITGNSSMCAGSSQTYTIPSIPNMLSYTWTLPSGWTGSSNTNSITVNTGAASGTISVSAYNGCQNGTAQTKALTIATPVTPTATVTPSGNTICDGTNVTFNAAITNGGTTPSYQWKINGVGVGSNSPAFSANYLNNGDVVSVVLTSSAPCPVPSTASSNNVAMTVNPNVYPGINISSTSSPAICQGTSVTFTSNTFAPGTAPIYQWRKNGLNVGTNSPTYTTTAIGNGDSVSCILTSNAPCPVTTTSPSNKLSFSVIANIAPSAVISAFPGTTFTPGQPVTFTATVNGTGSNPQYYWAKNSQTIPGAMGLTYTTSNLVNGDVISFHLVSSAPCAFPPDVFSNNLSMKSSTGIGNVSGEDNDVKLIPNPNAGTFTVKGKGGLQGKVEIQVVNTLGQVVLQQQAGTVNSEEWNLPVSLSSDIANGAYFIRIESSTATITKRFELNR